MTHLEHATGQPGGMDGTRPDNRLTTPGTGRYPLRPVRENTSNSGTPSRQPKAFFSSTGFTPMGGMGQNYKTRKGNTARRLFAVFNILPTLLENKANISNRSNHHAN